MQMIDDIRCCYSDMLALKHRFFKMLEQEKEHEEAIWQIIEAVDDFAMILGEEERKALTEK